MIISLEYVICQLQQDATSVAIKSHRGKRQNPGLEVLLEKPGVTWQLLGLVPGTIEQVDPRNPAATRLDFYIGRYDFLIQRNLLPPSRGRVSTTPLSLTNPTGSVRKGGKKISWRGPILKHEVNSCLMYFPDTRTKVDSNDVAGTYLNIDWEPAMYPLSDGKRSQLHFGIQTDWSFRENRQRKAADAKIFMSHAQYARVRKALFEIR